MILQGMYTSYRLFELVIRTSLQYNLTLNNNPFLFENRKGIFMILNTILKRFKT